MGSKIISAPFSPKLDIRGLGQICFDKMVEHKDKIAYTNIDTDATETYRTVLEKAVRVALTLRGRGIRPGDIITICSKTNIESFITFYGCCLIGAVTANLDPKLPLTDMVHLVNLVKPKIIFAVPEVVGLIEDVLREVGVKAEIVVFGETVGYDKFSNFLVPSVEEEEFVPYEPEDIKETAVIVFSSGSTGLPKGICLSHCGVIGIMHQMRYSDVGSTLLAYANLYWISAITWSLISVYDGYNRLICSVFDPKRAWDLIEKYKVKVVFVNAYQLIELCKSGRPEGVDVSSVQYVMFGGAPTTKKQNLHFRDCFSPGVVVNAYGQTEVSGLTTILHPHKYPECYEKYPGSVGKLIPGYLYKVVNPDTEELLGPNQEGELRVKCDFLMNGYYNQDSSGEWDVDGFLKTGDVVYYNEDQCFFVVNRIKELLKYQMWHVSPVKIETILLSHPAVLMCVVVGIPHQVDGDHLLGLVVLKAETVGTVTEDELRGFVDNQVGDHQKLRAGVRFIDKLPLTAALKINRVEAKRRALELTKV